MRCLLISLPIAYTIQTCVKKNREKEIKIFVKVKFTLSPPALKHKVTNNGGQFYESVKYAVVPALYFTE